jgi:NAD(P)-dependent dehydrogenase (short-subunit alcohol dehydrogenase family)
MKTILITGANGFLGTATVRLFLEQGYRVIALDHSESHLGFARESPGYKFLPLDLNDEKKVETELENLIRDYGRIDGALMIAGGFAMGSVQETKLDEIRQQISLNFETAYILARPLIQHMKQNGYGRLVFIGARPALVPSQGKNMTAYALSKSLLFRLAELINEEAKGKNVVASVLVPSTLDTPANRSSMPEANFQDWVAPEQVSAILEFICSEKGMPLREPVYKVYNNS